MMKKPKIDTDAGEKAENTPPEAGQESIAPVQPQGLTPKQLEELEQRASKADEHWDRLVRTTADFDNFKKRAARERQEAVKYANEALLEKLIPILDTFDMALAAARNTQAGSAQSLQDGITMVHQQLKNALNDAGLEEIDGMGKPFDPNFHEAISMRETAEAPEGQVVQQLRKGYKLRDRLLRAASVIVAKAPAAPPNTQ